jgi:hypothetical protein
MNEDRISEVNNFLLAEFNALQTRAIAMEQAKSNQVNFFLVAVGAITAGIFALSDLQTLQTYLIEVIVITSFLILLLGFATLNQSINYSAASVSLYRRAGRIRQWYLNADEKIKQFVPFIPGDDRPRYWLSFSYAAFRGGDAVILIINSVSFAIFTTGILFLIFQIPSLLVLVIAGLLAIISWYLQQLFIKVRLLKVEAQNIKNIHFPSQQKSK